MAQALDHPVLPLTFVADADLTASIYCMVKHTTGERLGLCGNTGAGFLGVLYKVEHDPSGGAAGDELNVMVLGVAVVKTGGAFTPGARLTSDGSGRAVAAASAKWHCGIALEEATAADQYVAMLIIHGGLQA